MFSAIAMLIGYSFLFGCIGYRIYKDYKLDQDTKRKRLLDSVPCLCGHKRWMHYEPRPTDPLSHCVDHDGMNFTRCPCNGYRMDNLIFLERVQSTEEGRPYTYYTL